jgi:RNA polymerase sigma factor (sigma-70 family)
MNAPVRAPSDRELVAAIKAGDDASLADLYERYADRLFDFAARIVRDREAATEIVQVTFVRAWGSLQRRPAPTHPKAWLYAIARNAAIDEVRRRGRSTPTYFDEDFVQVDMAVNDDPELQHGRARQDRDLAALVWSAAAALNPNEYSLLDMQLRQGLSIEEIALVLGVSRDNMHKKLSRLRQSLEEAVAVELLRVRSDQCAELDAVVARIGDGPLTPTRRRAVSKHVRGCEVCGEDRRQVVAPAALFSSLAPVALTVSLRTEMLDSLGDQLDDTPGVNVPPSALGRLRNRWGFASRRTRIAIVAGALAAITVAVILLVIAANGAGSDVRDPDDALSPSHDTGVPSSDRVVLIAWSPTSGAEGFSIDWTSLPDSLPDRSVDLSGDTTQVASPELGDGTWYFHLRTRGASGTWTSTVHLGPFVIAAVPESSPPSSLVAATATEASTTTTMSATTTTSSTTTTNPTADLVGLATYTAVYGEPSGGCGFSGFSDTIEIGLRGDGAAALTQAQHLSKGTWKAAGDTITIELTLDGIEPETYMLESTDRGATYNGENTFLDSSGCLTTFPVEATLV